MTDRTDDALFWTGATAGGLACLLGLLALIEATYRLGLQGTPVLWYRALLVSAVVLALGAILGGLALIFRGR